MDLERILNIWGWPTAILVVIGVAARAVWAFAKPQMALWFEKHFALLDKLTRRLDENTCNFQKEEVKELQKNAADTNAKVSALTDRVTRLEE